MNVQKYFILGSLFYMALSCVNADGYINSNGGIVIDPNLETLESYKIEPQAGGFTVLTYGEDTLAVTDIPMSVKIPSVMRLANGSARLKEDFMDYASAGAYVPQTGIGKADYLLLFEDSRMADFDYNDFVVHVNNAIKVNKKEISIDVTVTPIANGGKKRIAFGYDDMLGNEVILSDDVSRDYFYGKTMVNTMTQKPFQTPSVKGKMYSRVIENTSGANGKDAEINFFIKVDNNTLKFYVASVNSNEKDNDKRLPYGVALHGKSTKGYPLEFMFVNDAFPRFTEWAQSGGKKNSEWPNHPVDTNLYPIDIWEYIGK